MIKPAYLASVCITGCLVNSSVLAETDSTTQTINLIIPVVALLDIEDVSPQFTFQAPTNAGDGMAVSSANSTFTVALSSNNANAKLDVKVDQDLSSNDLSLTLSGSTLNNCLASLTLATNSQTYCNVGTTQTNSSTITMNAVAANNMASYGSYAVEVTYTLTDN